MKKNTTKILSILFVIQLLFTVVAVGVSAAVVPGEGFAVTVSTEQARIHLREKTQMIATITVPRDSEATDNDFTVVWSVNNEDIAVIDQNGVLTAKAIGEVRVTAAVTDKEQTVVTDSCTVYVVRSNNPVLNLLRDKAILGYRYNYDGDYFYTDNDNCWQSDFGFLNAFDLVCPYILIEYDYIRMHFNYGGKAWMIQLWKGQYGMVFYGSEIGVYYRDEEIPDSEDITIFTHYKCATEEENRLGMEMSLYRDEWNNGNFVHQFTRTYDKYWWCTGFLPGHLWESEPADELRMEAYIDFPDEGMAKVFGNQLNKCTFAEATGDGDLALDSYRVSGNRVYFKWQNISEAESSVVVKASVAALFGAGFFGILLLILGAMFLSGMAILLVVIL